MNYSKTLVFTAACAGMAFFGVAMLTMGAVLPELVEKFDLDDLGASSLVALLPLGILIGSLVFGPVVDRFGYKWLLIGSSLCAIIGLEGLAVFDSIHVLRACIFLIGLGGGILNGETNALVSDIYDDRQRGSKLSILGVFYGVGALGLPVLLGFLSKYYPYETILAGMGLFMALFVVFFLLIRFPRAKAAEDFSWNKCLSLLKKPALLLFSFVLFFESGFEGLCNNWTTTYLGKTTAIASDKVIFSLTWLVIGVMIGRIALGYLLTRFREITMLYACLFIALAGVILLGLSESMVPVNFSMTLIGIGSAAAFPVVFSYLGGLFKDLSGTAFSIALVIALVGNTLLNYLTGLIAQAWGISTFPVILAAVVVSMLVLLTISVKQIKQTKN